MRKLTTTDPFTSRSMRTPAAVVASHLHHKTFIFARRLRTTQETSTVQSVRDICVEMMKWSITGTQNQTKCILLLWMAFICGTTKLWRRATVDTWCPLILSLNPPRLAEVRHSSKAETIIRIIRWLKGFNKNVSQSFVQIRSTILCNVSMDRHFCCATLRLLRRYVRRGLKEFNVSTGRCS